ncbi:MAG: hypothetical protein F6J93_39990 [Oscillatoria sp. SIO1A7]|nr:hypothetical protein [Oscillatoria sp. SIO1A7]
MFKFESPKIFDRIVERVTREAEVAIAISETATKAIEILSDVPGMKQAGSRDFACARPIFALNDGTVVRTWQNALKVEHIFLADAEGRMIFGGYVGWKHSEDLKGAIKQIKKELV